MIVVENMTKRFGLKEAVHDISFTVDRGEILGFLGPNGAGKTTTMRILTCYFPPSSGRAQVDGFDVINDSLQVRQRVGYMPESVQLYPDMTVEAYLHFVASAKGVNGRDRRQHVEEVMHETAVHEVADYPISKISRGFRQRVGLAQAIMARPQVLILDEPTVGLDPRQIIEIRALIRSLAAKATVILSTHIMQEVNALCNRVIIIDNGVIRAVDTPDNLRAQARETSLIEMVIRGGEARRVCDELSRIEGVLRVDRVEDVGEAARYNVEVKQKRDIRAQLAASVVNADWSLLELYQKDMTLEEVFVKLVSHDTADDGKARDAETREGA